MTISIFNKTNYKKSKLEKLKSFCTVVENKDSILKASQYLFISSSAISKHISSLEQDLGFKLFDRNGKRLVLNKRGEEYYKIAKNLLLDIKKLYSPTLENIDKNEIGRVLRRKKVEKYISIVINYISKKMKEIIIKLKYKHVVIFIFSLFSGIAIYLNHTNYWFDLKLKKLANPLLKEVMEVGMYRLPENIKCPHKTMEIHYDIQSLAIQLIHDIKLFNISFIKCPMTQLRMNNSEDVNKKLFFNKNLPQNTCNPEERFQGYTKNSNMLRDMLTKFDNFKVYSLYTDENCINHDIFQDNIKIYKNIFAKKVIDDRNLSHGGFWIMVNKNYYYFFAETHGMQPDNQNKDKERYLIFKKLTLEQLKTFDNGSYWELIKEYNIKID